jgi:RimJ/RimL family protein N-acetyltransferase
VTSASWWPLFGLRIRTGRLELRLPTDADLADLAALAARGIHEPELMPFTQPWTDTSPEQRARSTMQWNWQMRAALKPDDWSLNLAVTWEGTVVGTQEVSAHDFSVLREVSTGSWLGLEYQGQGIGTEMRAAVLWFAFAALGAQYARSGAFSDNASSIAVSRKLGYRDDGFDRLIRRGVPAVSLRFRLDRETWENGAPASAAVDGLEQCLPLLGLTPVAT